MNDLLKRLIPQRLRAMLRPFRERYLDPFATRCYSQEGEDMVLRRLLESKRDGFYIDVGAHHPKRFSNTYFFYRRGWRGVNIDATPGLKALFDRVRPRDVNVEGAISRDGRELTLRVYHEGALNTLVDDAQSPTEQSASVLLSEKKLRTRRLADVLNEHVGTGQAIDFMSVDIEGMDLEALEGNDWSRFRPRYVLAECYGASWSEVGTSPVGTFMKSQGYEPFAKCVHTVFFRDARASS